MSVWFINAAVLFLALFIAGLAAVGFAVCFDPTGRAFAAIGEF